MSDRTIKLCSIDGCGEKHTARGWCKRHYYIWKRNGDPLIVKWAPRGPSCSIEGCRNKHKAYGWCENHYKRWQRHGDPEAGQQQYKTPEEAFHARTQWDGECLIWIGSSGTGGYGAIQVDGRLEKTHRYAWERENGPIPSGFEIDHICWNTACANIEHLRVVTRQQNVSNLSGARSNSSSGVRNVHKKGNGWVVRVRKNGVSHHFGTYKTIEEAAEVAERARKELFGNYAGRG